MKLFFKILLLLFAVLVLSAVILDLRIRHERKALQVRAEEFLSRPVPEMLQTNMIGGSGSGSRESVLADSRSVIERYANKGRIRQTSAISAQMALSSLEIAFCSDAAKTNKDALNYIEDCRAIRDEVWRMGFWQSIEDLMELKIAIREIEEENFKPAPKADSALYPCQSVCIRG